MHALRLAVLLPALLASGCYCSHVRDEPADAGAVQAEDAGAGAMDAWRESDANVACLADVDALARASELEALTRSVGFELEALDETRATAVTVSTGAVELMTEDGTALTFRWPGEPLGNYYAPGEDLRVSIHDGWHTIASTGLSTITLSIRALTGAPPPPFPGPRPGSEEMELVPACAFAIPACASGATARQHGLHVRWAGDTLVLPSGQRSPLGASSTTVVHVGSIESPLECGGDPTLYGAVAVIREFVCIC